jgi:hypothetical protein
VSQNESLICSGCKEMWYCSAECQRKVSSLRRVKPPILLTLAMSTAQDWKSHKPDCRKLKAVGDQLESRVLANPMLQLDSTDRLVKFLDHHQAAYSVAITTLFGMNCTYVPTPDLRSTHLLVLEFADNPNSRDNFDLLVLEKCYLQSRNVFLLTLDKVFHEELNRRFKQSPKNMIDSPALLVPLVKSKRKGAHPVLLPITGFSLFSQRGLRRNYVSHMVLKSLQWAVKGPVCLNDFEARYRSSLREARWGIQPHCTSFDYTSER